ncbi:MAG TPA: DUF6797 domain-containing protein [Gemmataceae bacterium]|nr:DUF6797 domain-containing protein [Gemmataceae bacterium]
MILTLGCLRQPRWLASLTVVLLFVAPAVAAKPKKQGRHELMDYGPYQTASIGANGPGKKNIAMKGMAIRLGTADEAAICFDTDLLRYSAGWTEGFLQLKGTPFDGSHGSWPLIEGKQLWGTPMTPGWARPGTADFTDPRTEPYGTLPRDWARFKGYYLHGRRVVLSYTVGDCKILERPGVSHKGDTAVFSRTFNLSASSKPLTMLVCEVKTNKKQTVKTDMLLGLGNEQSLTLAGLSNAPAGAKLQADGARILLKLPALQGPAAFRLNLAIIKEAELARFNDLAGKTDDSLDLTSLTKGGPPRWTETIHTKGTLGSGNGAYVVDTLTVPEDNPYKSWMRFGGFDFFSDGRAALCTWSGDVWIVSGIDDKLDKLTWKRYATGLFQPLGLKIVDDKVYTLGREGIVRLHDLNNDGEADFYEIFNGDVHTTPAFHEFAFDLQTDPEGNFYFSKAGPVRGGGSGFEYIAEHSGCILKVSKDGSKLQVFATGFRAPNGIGVGPKGEVTSGDNEGTWMPMCRLNLLKSGTFAGCVDTSHRTPRPTWYDDPICWLPKNVDNSNGGQTWITSDKWGPLKGDLLHTSYGTSSLYHVLIDPGDYLQGGVVRFPINFQTGVMRPRFSKHDGQLYITGLRGWQTNAPRDAAFQRVRYTGKPLHTVQAMRVTPKGIALTFTDRLDAKTAADAQNYSVKEWNYLWCSNYGSAHYRASILDFENKVREYNRLRLDQGKNKAALAALSKEFIKGQDSVEVAAARLGEDGKTVLLEIPGLKRVMQMHIKFKIKAQDGTPIALEVYNTVNHVPGK